MTITLMENESSFSITNLPTLLFQRFGYEPFLPVWDISLLFWSEFIIWTHNKTFYKPIGHLCVIFGEVTLHFLPFVDKDVVFYEYFIDPDFNLMNCVQILPPIHYGVISLELGIFKLDLIVFLIWCYLICLLFVLVVFATVVISLRFPLWNTWLNTWKDLKTFCWLLKTYLHSHNKHRIRVNSFKTIIQDNDIQRKMKIAILVSRQI